MLINPGYKKLAYNPRGYSTFSEFYAFYLGEHQNPICRRLHVLGTILGVMNLSYLLNAGLYNYLPLFTVPGYALAWIGHFFFEKNRPATFKHPIYSFIGDFRMTYEILSSQREF
ncbi:hypothetical protein BB561_004606 [Smittium simulii]|uniref:DUF962 domain-containing protein n=1 Tax=Smittium simulii TaxID=133385 RepID=A0A2T9YF96_9FUNG|nr:hypothetical protein BB561_004606 [Smittium simulii]